MATITANTATLLSLANQMGADGSLLTVAEVLNKTNPMIQDAPVDQSNETFSHKGVRRLSLPAGTWRKLNSGVANENTDTIPFTETIGMLETYSEVDKKLVDAAPNPMAYRDQRAKAFLEGLSQTLATALIYGNAFIDPEKITGLAPRMDSLATGHVIGCSGTGNDTTSIYIVQWGLGKVYLVYPKGSNSVGINHTDMGEVTLFDAAGNKYQGYRDHFEVNLGLVVEDERCIKRVANIETTGTTNIFDEDKLIEALNELPYNGEGAYIYVNKTIHTQMQIIAKDKTNITWAPSEVLSGQKIMNFMGHPVKRCDAILNTETAIS